MHQLQYKITVKILFYLSILGFLAGGYVYLKDQIPDHILVEEGDSVPALFHFPVSSFIEESVETAGGQRSDIPADRIHITGKQEETYQINCSLLGMIPLKAVEVSASQREALYPGGMQVGIYIETEGLLVIGTGTVESEDGKRYEPAAHSFQSGDYIIGVEGSAVNNKEELVECIHASEGRTLELDIERNGSRITQTVTPVKSADGEYKAGIWVRNDAQGVGTLTYEKKDGSFGALGHGISDVDTSTLLTLKSGRLYDTDILSVTKGEQGTPGELAGVIHYKEAAVLGSIDENTVTGIFGKMTKTINTSSLFETAYKQEVETGPAEILCSLGGEIKTYQIEIERVELNKKEVNKSMVIRVVDEDLLDKTGGIVQGMSGSPIIQNGKLAGAVTHVFVNDPARGYGIFIENMLEH